MQSNYETLKAIIFVLVAGDYRHSFTTQREKSLQRDKHSLTPETDTDILDNDDGTYLVRFRSTILVFITPRETHDRILLSTPKVSIGEK